MVATKHDAKHSFEEHFKSLFKDSPDSAIVVDQTDDKIHYVNNTFEKMFGSHKNFRSLLTKEDMQAFEGFKQELLEKRQSMFNCRVTTRDGNLFEALVRAYLVAHNEAIFQIFDVSTEARKREEDSQKKWIGYFERLFENSKDIMNLFSMTQRKILKWNPQAAIAMGYTKEELSNVPIEKIYPPEELLKLGACFGRLVETGFVEEKLKIYRKGKDLGDIWIRSFVIQYEPEVLCLVHTIDITEEKERERTLLKETRLAALGEASASLAHEINNSLQSIQFNLYLLKEEKNRLPEDCFKRLEKIEMNTTHIGSVVRNIQNYTHISRAGGKTHVFINSILESAKQILEGYIANRKVDIECEVEQSLPPVSVDPNQIQQIFLILMKNAIQAMGGSGARKLLITASSDAQGKVTMKFRDSGCGMPPEVQRNLFESFVTTKPVGIGLGLGLSVAKRLADANNIAMTFTSEVGVGTEFSLVFDTEKNSASAKSGPNYVLLYVDDKDSLFPSFEEFLASKNITVIRSQSAKEAVKTLVNNHVDFVICAENMYPVSGYAFLKEASNLFSGPICLTRDTNNPPAGGGSPDEFKNVLILNYPCEVEAFSKTVNEMMMNLRVEETV